MKLVTTHAMCSFDCETAGLKPGDKVHVVSLYDVRACTIAASFHGDSDTHILQAMDALEKMPYVVSFNGASFDFKMMSARLEHLHDKRRCARLALDHYDIMLDFACSNGYFSSLASFAQATLQKGKVSTGTEAITMWASGKKKEVVEYCEDDARLTGNIYLHGIRYGRLHRRTASGKKQTWALPQELFRKVKHAVKDYKNEPPDVSWMTDPPNIPAALSWAMTLVT